MSLVINLKRMPGRKAGQGEDLPSLSMQPAFSLEILLTRAEDKGHHPF